MHCRKQDHGRSSRPCYDDVTAELSRRQNDLNVLCLSGDMLGDRLVDRLVDIWLNTPFDGGRHARRLAKISEMESRNGHKEPDQPESQSYAGQPRQGGFAPPSSRCRVCCHPFAKPQLWWDRTSLPEFSSTATISWDRLR